MLRATCVAVGCVSRLRDVASNVRGCRLCVQVEGCCEQRAWL
jgi:hypothetical protein